MLDSPSDITNVSKPGLIRQQTKEDGCDDFDIINTTNLASNMKFLDSLSRSPVDVLMVGTGEYTTGYIENKLSETDKGAGVIALTLFDLRRRGKTNRLALCGVNGTKYPAIRTHIKKSIADVYSGIDISVETFPADDQINPKSYIDALNTFQKGDAVIIFTPDDTHFEIALEAVKRGMHVLVTKPLVKTLEHHEMLHKAAKGSGSLVITEVHKRFDPIYQDARDKLKKLGQFSYFCSYMSQPKYQLETFKSWAGKSSDISYYLNSHHIDFHEWCVGATARPITVVATASTGIANHMFNRDCEDTITLTVQWENIDPVTALQIPASLGTAVYTASWAAPKSDVHSQQRFFCMHHGGEVTIDQAHRGYTLADDGSNGLRSVNPLFMKYTPTNGCFSGQNGYGYRSIEAFVNAVSELQLGTQSVADFDDIKNDSILATIAHTYRTTAILEAGRRSLDTKRSIIIDYGDKLEPTRPTGLREV